MEPPSEDITRVMSGEGSSLNQTLNALPQPKGELNWTGARLGRYLLVELLGRGAFGTVWAAYDPELDRKVAIKVLPLRAEQAGHDELLAEAQLPAQLSHPNVVAIHDVGRISRSDAEALPGLGSMRGLYVVMEHLGGPTLRKWVNQREPSVAEVVRALVQAGRGLEAAHARKLIHLDFKPGNVMFGEDGRPRVLDFGLARVLRGGAPSESGTMIVAGTPVYMAPEQHAGDESDERTDQYAFAVTLWEALYGAWPFEPDESIEARAGKGQVEWLREMVRLKLAGPPAPPRKAELSPQVRTALVRALDPKPEQRFASMGEMLATLEDQPNARRRPWIAAGFGLALIAGFTVALSSQSDPCALPSDRFEGVWDEAEASALEQAFAAVSDAELSGEIIPRVRAGLDEQIQRWTAVHEQICTAGQAAGSPAEAMSEELLCLEAHLARIAALSASLREADADTVARAADSVLHLPAPEDCREARRARVARELDEHARAAWLALEGELARAEAEFSLGRYDAALATAEHCADQARARAEFGELLARAELTRADTLVSLGRFDESRAAVLSSLHAAESSSAERVALEAQFVLARGLNGSGGYDESRLLLELAEARLARADLDDPRLAVQLDYNYSQLEHKARRWDQAIARAEQAFARQQEFAPEDEVQLADLHLTLGNAYVSSTRNLEAGREHYERAHDIWLELYGPGHPLVATVLLNLSGVYFRTQELDEARDRLLAAAQIFAYTLPPTHPNMGVIHQNLAAIGMISGRYAEAIEHSRLALGVMRGSVGSDSVPYAVAEANLCAALLFEEQHAEALEHARHIGEVYGARLEPEDGRQIAALTLEIESLWGLERHEEAAALLPKMRERSAAAAPDDPRQVEAKAILAEGHRHAGEFEQAFALSQPLLERMRADEQVQPEPLVDVSLSHAQTLRGLGREAEARALLEAVLAQLGDDPHVSSWALLVELGHIARDAGEGEQREAHYQAARELLGESAPKLAANIPPKAAP